MTLNIHDPYLAYYKNQLGSGVSVVYKGAPHQRGHGIGSFLGGLFRSIAPLLKSGAKAVGQEALRSGINVLSDIAGTMPPNKAFGVRMKEFTTNLKRRADNKIDNVMKGSGYKRKRARVTTQSLKKLLTVNTSKVSKRRVKSTKGSVKSKRLKKVKDIFD